MPDLPISNDRERHAQGMKVRRAVLGDRHVDNAQQSGNAFSAEFQDLITRYAWGEIWSRPGLPLPSRSLLTLAMLIALNRGDEFRLHLRAALHNGVTRDEIKEVLLQSAIYCGVPAANSAFHLAAEVFNELDSLEK
ncbi:MAG TPA: 4-carboxymuconolactone decarboxylase [Candidatus Acidoferrum sp.]|nr:4-carboxymuconolactone decarboxylase [Candidatus Acidoferrum sp.]